MASYNKKQDFEQWLSEHDPDSKKYKYRDKSAYSYIREQKETASIPRTREVERAYAENPAGWENSKNMQAASVVPRAEDYRAAAYAYSVRGRQQKPIATSRNPRSSYYNPNWQKEINEREAQKRQAAQVAADNRAAEHAARIQQRSNAITSIMQRYASAPDFESGIEKGKALYSNTQGQSGEKTPSFMDIYSGALNPGSISPKTARGLVKQGERQQLDAMSEDEKNIYYYLLGTKGDAAANEFKSLLDDELNRRIGTAQAEQAEILGTAGVLPFVAGVESSYAGAAQALLAALGSEKTVPRSPYQYAYQAWRERIAQQENNKIGLRGIANDLGYTVGNMLPGMELSAAMGGLGAPSKLASALGSGSIGLSSGGNAYREGRDMGYSHNEAITYGALTGASEAGLQYLLGGVSKLGAGVTSGKVANVVSKALDKVVKNKAVADTVARYVADMGSEATEEYLQSVLEPVFRNIAAGENNDIDLLSDEALYSAMMGALTAGLFNAPEMASGINNARSTAVAEHLEPSNAQLKYFTPEEASDPRQSRSRMGAYAKEFGDVLNSTSPDPARMREMQDIVSEYNTLRAMNRADAIEQAATQAARTQEPATVQRAAEMAAKAAQTQPPTNIQEAAAQAAEKAVQSPLEGRASNNAAALAKTAQNGVATRHTATTSNGNAVSVGSIVETDNGLNVRLSDGTTAQLSDVDFDDPNINVLYERAASFDVDTANALVNNYTGETSVDNYLRGFNSVYLSGKQGYEYAKAVGDSVYARHYLNDNARMAAFRAGQAAYQSSRANSIAGQQGNNVRPQAKAEYEAGVNREYSDRKLTSSQRKQIRALDEVFKAAGKKLVIHDAIGTDGNSVTFSRSDANAYYDAKTDTYHLSLDSTGQAYAYVVAHESIHEMKVKNKEGFSALSEVVEAAIEGELMNQKGMTFDEAKAEFEKMVQYQMDKNGLSRSDAVTEVVANTVPVILTDEQQGKRFADKVMKSGSKVKAWFEKLIKDLRAILDKAYNILKGQKSWEQMELIRNNKQTLDMIADYYFEGMEGTRGKAKGDNVNLSLKDIGGRKTVWIENNALSAKELRNHKAVADYIAKHIGEVYTLIESGQKVYLGEDLPTEYTHSKYTTYLQKYDRSTLKAKNKASGALGEMIEIATNRRWEKTQHTHNKDARYGMYRYDSSFAFPVKNSDGSIKRIYSYDAELLIRNASDGKKYLYDIINIKENIPDTLELPKQEAQMRSQEAPAHGDAFSNIISSDGKDVKLSTKDINADIREVNPMEITPPNRVTSSSKYHYLINEFENNGYNGRRVVLVENGNDGYQALTGSHRILAAREAGVDVPSVVIPMSEEIQPLLDATGDEERARIADELYEDGIIPKEVRDLLVREDELDFENVGKPLDKQVRFSEKDTEQKAVSTFGTTYSWNETGYLTPSGKQLDFSGKRDGAQAGYRSMDHRDVSELYDAEGVGGTDAMIKFMNEGNIRISPEMGGINLQSMPTKAQFDKLQSFVRKNGGEVTIDFDDANGNTLHSIEYPQGTGPVRINNDIKRYYNEGKVPEISETQRFSFSRKDDVSVTPEDAKKLQKQNDKLKQALEVAKQEIKLSDGHHVKASAVERLAGSLLKEYSSKMDKAELVSNITELFDYIGNGENVVWDEVQAGAMNIALNVLDQSSKRNTEWYDNTKPAREFLKNNTIKLNEKQLAEVQSAFGSYTEFRRELYNKAKFSKTEGISLEQAWRDLSGMFPDTFDPDTPDVDMPTLLHDEVLNMYDRPIENPYGYGMKEYAADLAMRLYGEYMAMPERKTFADKQQKKLEMQRARYNTLMEQQREQAKAKYEKLRDQRDITKYKTSIEKNAKSLYNWLTKPNNSKHVPEALRNKTADLLKTLEFDGKKGYMWKDAMRNLQTWMQQVDRAKTNPDIDNPLIEYAPDLIDNMQSLLDSASKYNNISDMPLDKLKELNNIVAAVKHTVTTANTVIADGRRQYIDDIGGNIIKTAQVQRPKAREFMRKHPYAYKMASAVSGFFNSGNVKPIYFFDNIGGEMKTLFNDVRQASYKSALTANTIREEYAQIKDKYHYKEWADKKGDLLTIQTNGGSNVSITREQALDIYATAKREKLIGTQHLTKDGFVFDKDVVQKNGKLIETATNDNVNKPLSEETIAEISDWLTKEQKGYADALVELMSTKGAELGNEVTMQMYGINRFAESYYIPIMSAQQFIETAFNGRVPEAMSWMNKGFTKNTVAGARNPIVITGITQKALQHMADMATYNAMAIPQDTMAKVYNYKQRSEDGGANTYIRAELDKAYGQHTSKYIKTFINDISGNITVDPRDSMASKMISAFRRNAVAGKLSVAIQQPSAIIRATALVDPKYFFGHVGKNTYDTAKKYSGTAVIKEVGGFDAYTGKGLVQWMADNDKLNFRNVRDAVAGWLPQKMDEITWCRIWKACENEVADTTAFERGSEEFYKAVGHRFDDVIEYTQVYDSVISRSEYMRSKSAGAKLFTSFKAEPTVSYNMYWYALKHMNEKGGKARLLRAAASIIGAGVFNAMLKSVITAIRDDDENQNYVDKYVEALAGNLVGTPLKKVPHIGEYIYLGGELDTLGSLPLVNEVMSMLQGYTSSRSELKVIQDLINAAGDLDNENKGRDERWLRMAKATSQMFGIPLDAFIKDWLGVVKEAYKAISGNEPELSGNILYEIREGLGVKQELELYKGVDKAITTGDYTRLDKQFKTMVERDTTTDPTKKARETVRAAVRQYFDAGEVKAGDAKRILVRCGYKMDDAEAMITKWDFWRDYPEAHDTSVENNTEKLAEMYFEHAKPANIDKAVFYDVYKFMSKQGTKKEEAMAYINKQNLTKAQKDALYLCKYAESKIDEAPWR